MAQDAGNASLESLTFLARSCREEIFTVQYVWSAFAKVMSDANAQVRFRHDLHHKFQEAVTSVTTDHLLATIVFRRWALQLQAMSWVETALQRSWQHLRPEDLTAFAFSALRPHWPSRLLGLSHRSMDVKGALRATPAWGNFRYSIDATWRRSG
jgi:hypothetical protein